MIVKRSVFAAAVAVVLGAGCGGSKSLSDEASVRAVADAFAHAVDPEANPAKLCALLLGEARRNQGCGTEGEDIGPLLQLAIDSERDVRVVKIQGDEAVAEIPSIPIGPGHPKGAGPPQVLQLHKFDGQWRFTRLELSEPQTASRSARAVAFTRDCGSRVEDGTLRPNRRRDVIAGPLVLYGLREAARAPASSFRGRYGRHQPWKAVTEVAHGSDVLVQIQQRYRGRVSLLYRFPGGDRSGYRLSDGDLAVRFKPCPPSEPRRLGRGTVGSRTQFNGGFVVAGPQCVELRVAVAGRPREIHRRVSFGTSSACESGAGHRSLGAKGCPVTIPNGTTPPGQRSSPGHHGNGRLWTVLPLDGKLVVTNKRPGPFGTTAGYVHRDGSISVKWPWWGIKSAGRRLIVIGRRRGSSRPRILARIRERRTRHFWASVLRFRSRGCWRVTARAARARLSFVVAVSVA
jgi:hypothetical protein